jgi:hypothetical protein
MNFISSLFATAAVRTNQAKLEEILVTQYLNKILLELLSVKELQVFIPFCSYKKLCMFVKSLIQTSDFIKITAVPRA